MTISVNGTTSNYLAVLNAALRSGSHGDTEVKRDILPLCLERRLANGLRVVRPRVFVEAGELHVQGFVTNADRYRNAKDVAESVSDELGLKLAYEIQIK